MMTLNIREQGQAALNQVPDAHLPVVVRWLELLAELKEHPDIEPEDLWLLATGKLEKMIQEIDDATPLTDWRQYLDEL